MKFDENGDLIDNDYYCSKCKRKLEIFMPSIAFRGVTSRCECGETDFDSLRQFVAQNKKNRSLECEF